MVLKCICYNMFLLRMHACYIVYEHVTKQLENQNNCTPDNKQRTYGVFKG
jgi:hypothetical protein